MVVIAKLAYSHSVMIRNSYRLRFIHCFIGAITFFNQTKGEQSYITFPGLVSTKIDVWLNGQANDPVFKWYLNDLKINLPNKSYSRDNRLNILDSSH